MRPKWRQLGATLVVVTVFISFRLIAQDVQPTIVLFQNVRVFDGKSGTLSGPSNVLVRGNKFERISTAPIPTDRSAKTQIIDGGGRTLMPGLIDVHWHAMLIRVTPAESFGDVGYNNLIAGAEAEDTLMRGFTTVRDVGGPVFGLKHAIDNGTVVGPRIYPSGAVITVTSGHGDFRQLTDLPRTIGGTPTRGEQIGATAIADSPDEVRVRVREQLMQGASQIKLTAGGGVSSPFSPIDVSTFTEAELRAAVEAAENGVWLSTQPLPEELRQGFPVGSVQRAKADEVWPGIARTYELAKKYKIKTAWGTDVLFSQGWRSNRGQFWPRSSAGTVLPKRSQWQPEPTPNCWHCPANAILIRASSELCRRARSLTCCLLTAT